METIIIEGMRSTGNVRGGKRIQTEAQYEGRHVKKDTSGVSRHQRRRNIQQIVHSVVFILSVICMFAFCGSYMEGYSVVDVWPGVTFAIVMGFFSGTRAGILSK